MPANHGDSSTGDVFLKQGLTTSEARARLVRGGENLIERRKQYSKLGLFLSQFTSPLIYILVVAGVITFFLGEVVDSAVIWAAVLINTVLGFWQEYKAAKSLEALRKFLNPQAKVIRDGERKSIPLNEVVVGDVCVLGSGESIPADGLVVEANELTINEAILTGESVAVQKSATGKQETDKGTVFDRLEAKHKVFMGTMVEVGIGLMLVERTGTETEMGKIAASLVETDEEKTPLQQRLAGLSKTLALIVFGLAILILVIGLAQGHEFVEMFETAVAVAVAAIPEGLVVAMTVILALGMQRILKRKALVRKLVAAETLGGVSVICVDKTGTLTEGKMKVVKTIAEGDKNNAKKEEEMLLRAAAICNDQRDPLEVAMDLWVKEMLKGKYARMVKECKRLDEIPFSSERKFIATLHEIKSQGRMALLSGAPEVVMVRTKLGSREKEEWSRKLEEAGSSGYRLIGFAYKKVNSRKQKLNDRELTGMKWMGMLVFEDPVRAGVADALAAAKSAGINVKVITGDYRSTAVAVMESLKINHGKLGEEEIIEGTELRRYSPQELRDKVAKVQLFVRTTPDQKLKIVEALQARGEVVAMMGDGVNDAPAIKKADIGIVVNEASDVSKETADMVLLDSNFGTIVEAVREGRVIYETIRKVIVYLLSSSFTELILISGSLLLGLPLAVTAVQILWVNLIEDGLPSVALAFERNEPGVMEEIPKRRTGSLLDKEMKILIFVIGITTDLLLFGLFILLLMRGFPIELIRTFIFVGLGIDSLLYVFSVKTLRRNIWNENLFDNAFLLVSVAVGFGLLVPAVYLPGLQNVLKTEALPLWSWGVLFGLGLVKVAGIEGVKYLFLQKRVENWSLKKEN